jgi:uncharacterized protein (UPF0335 family)
MEQRTGSNEFNAEQITGYLDAIDKADDEILELKASHAAQCKGPRGRIRNVMKQAKHDGMNMQALRTVVAAHRAERRIDQKIAELEADDLADYQLMEQALGAFADTPLGAAAVAKAKQRSGDDVVDNLRAG